MLRSAVFIVPMKTPGVVAKVIPGVSGAQSFHEVFFTNVEVSDADMLGPEGQGWKVMKHVLQNERIGAPRYSLTLRGLDRAVELLKARGRFSDPLVRSRAARARAACETARLMCYQVIDGRVKGHPPSALTNLTRYQMAYSDRQVAEFLGDFMQEELVANEDKVISATYRRAGSAGIAAGAAEIQLNQVARNELRLPRD